MSLETLPHRYRVATSTPLDDQRIANTSMPISHQMDISAQSSEDIVDSSFDMDPFVDYSESFWQDDVSEEVPDIEFNGIADAEVYLDMGSQRTVRPCRANNDSQGDRDIWAEMEQNERTAHIVAELDSIGLRETDVDNNDDGDVEMQMIIEQSVRENLDIVAEFTAQAALPPYQPSENPPPPQLSLPIRAPIINSLQAFSMVPLNTVNEDVEIQTAVATTEQDMPPTYSDHSETEWEVVSEGTAHSSVEDDMVIVPSSPPPAYSEDSGSDSDGFRLV